MTSIGSLSAPIVISLGRSSFDPELSHSYDSSTVNGPVGFDWSLSLPFITRKTDNGLLQYNNIAESNVFSSLACRPGTGTQP
jgi:hypothetical protein